MSSQTIFNCQSIVEQIEDAQWLITIEDGTKITFHQGIVGGINTDSRDAMTEVTGDPITSIKQENYCYDESNKEFVTYTTESE